MLKDYTNAELLTRIANLESQVNSLNTNLVNNVFSNSQDITTTADSLSEGWAFGRITGSGVSVNTTGLPKQANGNVAIANFGNTAACIFFFPVSGTPNIYEKRKSSGTWESGWTEIA